jgi:hypothetical protein
VGKTDDRLGAVAPYGPDELLQGDGPAHEGASAGGAAPDLNMAWVTD